MAFVLHRKPIFWSSYQTRKIQNKGYNMTRLERLEISLQKAIDRVPEIEAQIAEERKKIDDRKDAEMQKFLDQKAKFEKLYGALPAGFED